MNINKNLYLEPINIINEKIKQSPKNIILFGNRGAGKTTILNELLKREELYIDGMINIREYLLIKDEEIYELYHTSLIIKKILSSLKNNNLNNYYIELIYFENYINNIIREINYMYLIDNYNNKYRKIDYILCQNPSLLFDKLLSIISKFFIVDNLKIVLDNFDTTSKRYQIYVYNLLKKYLKVIISTSDHLVINNKDSIKNNEIIGIDYNMNLETLKIIFNQIFRNELIDSNKKTISKIDDLISNEVLLEIITKTKGNIFDMVSILSNFFKRRNMLDKNDYNTFIINFLTKEVNENSFCERYSKLERKLHIL